MRKILVLENVSYLEERFLNYLNKFHSNDEVVKLFSIAMDSNKDKVYPSLKDSTFTDLMMESTFSDINQLLHLAGFMFKYKDEINIRTVTIMYTYEEFDIFLNKLVRSDDSSKQILKDFFSVYTVNCINWKSYERDNSEKKYFKEIVHYYQTVEVKIIQSTKDNYFFEFEHSVYIDPREGWRPKALVAMNREVITGDTMKDFFKEVSAMLDYQKQLIEENSEKNPDFEKCKNLNENNEKILNYLKTTFRYEEIKQKEFLK